MEHMNVFSIENFINLYVASIYWAMTQKICVSGSKLKTWIAEA